MICIQVSHLNYVSQNTGKPLKHSSHTKNGLAHRSNFHNDLSPEQIIAGFNARRASPGYQDMLVSLCFRLAMLSYRLGNFVSINATLFQSQSIEIKYFQRWRARRYSS
jgi:hypothetical protein